MTLPIHLVLAPALLAATARADEPSRDIFAGARLTLSAEPGAWYVAPGGEIRFPRSTPGANSAVDLHVLDMDSPRLSPSIEVNVSSERWGGSLRATTFTAHARGFTEPAPLQLGDNILAANTPARTSLDYTSLELEARYRLIPLWQDDAASRGDHDFHEFDRCVDIVGGLRLVDFNLNVTPEGSTTSIAEADATYAMPLLGLKGSMEFVDMFTIDAQTTFAAMTGDKSAFAWDIMLGFQYRPTPNLGFQLGYRQLLHRYSEDGSQLEWDGALAGFYATLVARF